MPNFTTCLWFDGEAEEAAAFYTSVFPNSRINGTLHYMEAGKEIHAHEPGSVLTVDFELDGKPFMALNGGPQFRFTEAVSLVVHCETQAELDHYWDRLSEGGDESAQQCGWLKDRYGLSWQVVPASLPALIGDPDPEKAGRVMNALLGMKKLDIAALERAREPQPGAKA